MWGGGLRWRHLKAEPHAAEGNLPDGRAQRARVLLLLVAVALVAGPLVVYYFTRMGGAAK